MMSWMENKINKTLLEEDNKKRYIHFFIIPTSKGIG